jgi:long-chain acyl-CoA synthetase
VTANQIEAGTIVELFRTGVATNAGAWAREHRDGAWVDRSFDDLAVAVERTAAGLIALGIVRGDRVALLCSTRPEWCEVDFGILCSGATTIPVYPSNAPIECLHVLRDSASRVVICENEEQLAKVREIASQLTDLEHVVMIDGADPGGAMSLHLLRARGDVLLAGEPTAVTDRAATVEPDDACTFVYTSGTTGPPKGCVILHRNYRAMIDTARRVRNVMERGDSVYLFLPLAHVFARMAEFWCVAQGCTLVFARGVDRIAEDLGEVRPQVLPSVPRIFEKIHAAALGRAEGESVVKRRLFAWAVGVGVEVSRVREAGDVPAGGLARRLRLADRLVLSKVRERLGGVRVCISGGAPIAPEILRFFHGCGITVLEGYGMTESSTAISINRPDRYRFGTVGIPFDGCEVRIADDGEVLVRGPNVFAGYHGLAAATAATVIDGWLHTGDIGSFDADGFLSITDRKKDIIITAGGKNITPANLENGLKTSPYIAEACVIGDRRPYLGVLLTLDADEVRRYARAHDIAGDDEALRRAPAIIALVEHQIGVVNDEVARVEQIKRYRILDAQFTQASGELTPTLKLKRKVVAERYAGDVEALYAST